MGLLGPQGLCGGLPERSSQGAKLKGSLSRPTVRVRYSLPLNLQAARARESTQAGSRDLPTGPPTRDLVLSSRHGRLSHTATARLDPGRPGQGSPGESGFPYLCRRFADAVAGFPTRRRGSPAYTGPCLAAGDLGCDWPGSSTPLLTTCRGSRSLLGGAGCPYRIVIAHTTLSYCRLSFRTQLRVPTLQRGLAGLFGTQ